jgi:hypothetical protein
LVYRDRESEYKILYHDFEAQIFSVFNPATEEILFTGVLHGSRLMVGFIYRQFVMLGALSGLMNYLELDEPPSMDLHLLDMSSFDRVFDLADHPTWLQESLVGENVNSLGFPMLAFGDFFLSQTRDSLAKLVLWNFRSNTIKWVSELPVCVKTSMTLLLDSAIQSHYGVCFRRKFS